MLYLSIETQSLRFFGARERTQPRNGVFFLLKSSRKMYDASTTPWEQYSHLQEEMSHACLFDLWQSMRLGIEFLPSMRETAHTSSTSVFPAGCGALLPLVRSNACERLELLH